MKLYFLDVETTGLDPEKDEVIEFAGVLFEARTKKIVEIFSTLVKPSKPLTDEIKKITGIQDDMLEKYGMTKGRVATELLERTQEIDFFVAHNAPFDRAFVEDIPESAHDTLKWPYFVPWIDTCVDIEYPENITTRKLTYLAAEHGFVNPFPHRALFDVLTMMKIFDCYDLDKIIERSKSPNLKLKADVEYKTRKLASDNGYRWDADKKLWSKNIKEMDLEKEMKRAKGAGFNAVVVDE